MSIKEAEVWIGIGGTSSKIYEDLGYEIPRYLNNRGKLVIKKGTKILVKVEDLSDGSSVKLTKICDVDGCGKEDHLSYSSILRSRINQKDGLDRCNDCSFIEFGIKKSTATIETCVATTHPEFAKLFWNVDDTFKYAHQSNRRVDFKCHECNRKIENKVICSIYRRLSCPHCSDGLSYPEKFIYSMLEQLGIDFEFQKIFIWMKDKKYDFYIPSLNTIIETHGIQHSERSFVGIGGRTLEEEQENDRLKENTANKNGIKEYIPIDCRKSELEFIKRNIINSKLNGLLDLSRVDWLRCHEFTCSTFVKKACDLFNEGNKSTTEIGDILNLNRNTITDYLKQGAKIEWCNYDPKEEKRKTITKNNKLKRKEVVQLSLNGEFIREWECAASVAADRMLNIHKSSISVVCNGKRNSAGGYKWMFKEDYELLF